MALIFTPRKVALAVGAAAVLVAVPSLAEAQRRRVVVRGPVVHTFVHVRPYYYPRFYYDGWSQWGYPPYYRDGVIAQYSSALRIQVTPREAEVFVDGYRAGVVDDFDGVFQRLRLRPGGHEITIFLEGYETARETIYLEPGAARTLEFSLNRLAAGERSAPPPAPMQRTEDEFGDESSSAPARPAPPARYPAPNDRDMSVESSGPTARFGTLSLRVQPGDAEILIDGERWAAPGNQDRISIQLSEGRHRVEVRRQGMNTYSEDVLIRRGATMTLNVSLK